MMTPIASSSIREVAIELMHVLRLSLVTREGGGKH